MPAPPDSDEWDVIVIGGGPPGENAAQYAVEGSRLRAVIVERELLGGECSYWACMPSKALLRPGELLDNARHVGGTTQVVGDRPLDVEAVLARRDDFISHLDDSSQVEWASGVGVALIRGQGRLVGERRVEVTGPDGGLRTLTARHAVVLATGTRALVPPVPGLHDARPWTSRDVTNLHQVPPRVVILGGGVVACESATWLHQLGCEQLSIVEMGPQLLGKMEAEAAEVITEGFRRAGVVVHLGRRAVKATRAEVNDAGEGHVHGGAVVLELDDGTTLTGDELVVAAGRVPNSSGLGLESVGVSADQRGFVPTDDHMCVDGTDWLYVVGDLSGRALLTHMGKYQARVAGDVIAARAAGRPLDDDRYRDLADHMAIPQVTFTDPEVGSVGLTASAARDAGIDVETADFDVAHLAGSALLRDDYVGWARLVVDRRNDTVVGATFVGTGTAELLHSATVAVVGRVPVSMLWHAVPSFPTVSEVWLRLLETLRRQRVAAG